MVTTIKNTVLNGLPVLRASFFEWIKSKRFLILEKRLLVVGFALLTLFTIFRHSQDANPVFLKNGESFSTRFAAAEQKLKNGYDWKPQGVGDDVQVADMTYLAAGAVIDVDSGSVLWSKNLQEKIAPASLSKLATVMTAIDISKLDKKVEVFEEAAAQVPTKLGLMTGEKLRLDDAIAASILTSANDAAETIASSLGASIGNGTGDFMRLVNAKVEKIGAENTHFSTATGLDDDEHFTTVYDLAIIGHEAYKNYPYIAQVAATEYKRLHPNVDHKMFDLPNWNALLGTYPGVDGLKIGYSEKAGHSTIVTAKRNGVNLMAIVIGAHSLEERELAAAALLNYGFGKYGIAAYPVEELDLVKRFEDWRRQLSMAN